MSDFCRHYPSMGLAFNDVCEAGVEMAAVRDMTAAHRYPCFDPTIKHLCPHHAPYTEEETAARNAALAEFMKRLDGLMGWADPTNTAPTTCLVCGQEIARLEQVGACVYARPCGHRQYQGTTEEE